MVRTETFSTKIAVIRMLNLLARGTRHATYSYVDIFDEIDIDQYSVAWEFELVGCFVWAEWRNKNWQ